MTTSIKKLDFKTIQSFSNRVDRITRECKHNLAISLYEEKKSIAQQLIKNSSKNALVNRAIDQFNIDHKRLDLFKREAIKQALQNNLILSLGCYYLFSFDSSFSKDGKSINIKCTVKKQFINEETNSNNNNKFDNYLLMNCDLLEFNITSNSLAVTNLLSCLVDKAATSGFIVIDDRSKADKINLNYSLSLCKQANSELDSYSEV